MRIRDDAHRFEYIARGGGFIHIRYDAEGRPIGRALRELPKGISESQVLDMPVNPRATPLQDRLRALEPELRSTDGGSTYAESVALADTIPSILLACDRTSAQDRFAQIKREALSVATARNGRSERARGYFGEMERYGRSERIERAREYFAEMEPYATREHRNFQIDGEFAAALIIFGRLSLALADAASASMREMPLLAQLALTVADELNITVNHAETPGPIGVSRGRGDVLDELLWALAFLGAPSQLTVNEVAQGLCDRAMSGDRKQAVLGVGRELKNQGGRLIEEALNSRRVDEFYALLYDACVYEIGARWVALTAAGRLDDTEAGQWRRRADNAEELWAAILASLLHAAVNEGFSGASADLMRIQAVRLRDGEAAARREAKDLVENRLLYPRCMFPELLRPDGPA
jgi:hypothetical protein